jgi:hypothetical protein
MVGVLQCGLRNGVKKLAREFLRLLNGHSIAQGDAERMIWVVN